MSQTPQVYEIASGATRLHVTRIPKGSDLLLFIQDFVRAQDIRSGWLSGIGAVDRAVVGYYDQKERSYQTLILDAPMEVLNLTGNVSLVDGQPMVHAHVTLSDSQGRALGGHLKDSTMVFAFELCITEFLRELIERVPEPETGLLLWR